MNPEQRNPAAENPEGEPASAGILPTLERGQWGEWLDSAWLREHAQNPAVRAAVIRGIFVRTEWQRNGGDDRIREILGLTDEEFRTPAAKAVAKAVLSQRLDAFSLVGVLAIERLACLGPDYFSEPETLSRLERVATRQAGNYERIGVFADLAALPLPAEFLERPSVRTAAFDAIVVEVYAGNEAALDLARTYGTEPADFRGMFANPVARNEVLEIAGRHVVAGEYDRYRKWADTFGFENDLVPEAKVLGGFRAILERGDLAGAEAFARRFPLGDRALLSPENDRSSVLGVRALIVANRIDAAQELAAATGLSDEQRDDAISLAVTHLIENDGTEALKALRETWNVSDEPFQRGATLAIESAFSSTDTVWNAWEIVARANAFSLLPAERLEEAVLRGQENLVSNKFWEDMSELEWEGTYFAETDDQNTRANILRKALPAELKYLREMRESLPIDAGFASRMERSNAVAVIAYLLGQGAFDLVDTVRGEFPSVSDADVRGAAMAIARSSVEAMTGPINEYLGPHALTWEEMREDATRYAKGCLLERNPDGFIAITERAFRIPAAEREAILEETREEVLCAAFDEAEHLEPGTLDRMLEIYGLSWETIPLRYVPIRYLLDAENEALRERRKSDPWGDAIAAMLRLQARSANAEHDPWVHELSPLVLELSRFGTDLDRESTEDGALLVEYVRTFGMMNLPVVSRVFLGLMRKPFADLDASDQKLLADAVGRKAARMESKQIVNELRLLRFGLQGALLRDEIPPRLATTIGLEIFSALLGSTRWTRKDDGSAILEAWKATATAAWTEGRREDVSVAPGYEEVALAVPRAYRSKDGSASAEEEIGKLLTKSEEPVENDDDEGGTYTTARLLPLGKALDELASAARWAQDATSDGETAGRTLKDLWQLFDASSLPDSDAFEALYRGRDDRAFVAGMERALSAHDTGRILRCLSAIHIARTASAQWTVILSRTGFENAEAEVRYRTDFITQYLMEHYLNPAQKPSHTGHARFPEPLRLALERAWGIGNDDESLVLATAARVDAIRARQKLVSKEAVAVALVPVQGPLRIYAGDVGDACYSSQHMVLAQGAFPRLKAMMFVTNRGKGTERMAGSVLLVETTVAESDERVLVVRANNPRQNLIAGLDAPSLVRQTIETAIATARRRKIKHVGVVRDQANAACSNRADVAAFYAKEYANNAPVRLANEPETNFNNYQIWNDEGSSPTVLVWTNDDPEAT